MTTYGAHLYRSARACDFQHQGSRTFVGWGAQGPVVSLHGWHPSRARRNSVAHQAHAVRGRLGGRHADHLVRTRRKTEGELFRLGSSGIFRPWHLRLADWLRRVQRQPFAEASRFELHRQPGGASSQAHLQGGVGYVPEEARDRLRRAIHLRMNARLTKPILSPLTGLGWLAHSLPRLTPWATICRRAAAVAPRYAPWIIGGRGSVALAFAPRMCLAAPPRLRASAGQKIA